MSKSGSTAMIFIGSNGAREKAVGRSSSDARRTDDGRYYAGRIQRANASARIRRRRLRGFKRNCLFSNFTDQRLYLQKHGSEPQPLTTAGALRYADGQFDCRRSLFFCVREDHSSQGEAVNTIVRIDLNGGDAGTIVVSGNDFYSSPRLSPDGSSWLGSRGIIPTCRGTAPSYGSAN